MSSRVLQSTYYKTVNHRSVFEGRIIEYWPSCMIKVTGRYESGQKMHEWLYFNKKGGLIYEVGYMKHDQENSNSFVYYEVDSLKRPI